MEKQLLKVYDDVTTAHIEMARLEREHQEIGYPTKRISPISFQIELEDGVINFWWEKGKIYYQ